MKTKFTPFNIAVIMLLVVGSSTLAWVVNLIWKDATMWGKDFHVIFFGSRVGENISLGIGLQVIHYYLAGILLLFSAAGLLLLKSWNNKNMAKRSTR